MKTFSEIVKEKDEEGGGYGIFAPPLTGQESVDILKNYLLGEDWYCFSTNNKQGNTEIVSEILWKYSRKYRKEVRRLNKKSFADFIRSLLPFKV